MTEYDAALKLDPNYARSLMGRGLAKEKTGDAAGGKADIEAAKKMQANVAEMFAR